MVYTGQPSKGCATCRKRRIKCDEKRPGCGSCSRVNQPCPGYRDQFDLAWRDQTVVAKKGVERGKARRKAAREREWELEHGKASRGNTAATSSTRDTVQSLEIIAPVSQYFHGGSDTSEAPDLVFDPDSEGSSTSASPRILSPAHYSEVALPTSQYGPYLSIMRPIPEEQALCFFFNHYVLPVRHPIARKGFFEYLGSVYSKSADDSPLRMSLMAVATCLMASRMGESAQTPLAQTFYVGAVTRIKEVVSKERDCTNNELIFAVMLLQYYELSIGHLQKRTDKKYPHLDGALALIRHRGPWNFTDPLSRSILLYVRGHLIDTAMRNGTFVPPDVETWINVVPESEQLPVHRLDTITLELANLRASLNSLVKPSIQSSLSDYRMTRISELMDEAISIDTQLYDWTDSLPSSWVPIRITRDNYIKPTLQLYHDYCDTYITFFLASVWNKLRLTIIEARIVILTCLSVQPQDDPSITIQQQYYIKSIQQLADDICASIPFYLGDRMKPGRAGDGNVTYPCAPGRPQVTDHYQGGPTMGGWGILQPLGQLAKMPIRLRDGQRGWIAGQMARTARIYNIALPMPPGTPTGTSPGQKAKG